MRRLPPCSLVLEVRHAEPRDDARGDVPAGVEVLHQDGLVPVGRLLDRLVERAHEDFRRADALDLRTGEHVRPAAAVHFQNRRSETIELELPEFRILGERIVVLFIDLVPPVVLIVEQVFHVPEAEGNALRLARLCLRHRRLWRESMIFGGWAKAIDEAMSEVNQTKYAKHGIPRQTGDGSAYPKNGFVCRSAVRTS